MTVAEIIPATIVTTKPLKQMIFFFNFPLSALWAQLIQNVPFFHNMFRENYFVNPLGPGLLKDLFVERPVLVFNLLKVFNRPGVAGAVL